jgi:hypothetical protein
MSQVKTHNEWEYVGDVWVDSGTIVIGDPCYLRKETHPIQDWDSFVELVHEAGSPKIMSLPNGTTLIQPGRGDGIYPVEVKRTRHGDVAEARIVFVDE